MLHSISALKDGANLAKALEMAGSKRMTSSEVFEQRISYVYSLNPKNGATKERIRQVILEEGGSKDRK